MAESSQEAVPSGIAYEGTLESTGLSGEIKLTIAKDGLLMASLFDQAAVPYSDIVDISMQNYSVQIKTWDSTYTVTRLGNTCEWFFRELYDAYNSIVLQAFFIEGKPDFETECEYLITEDGSRLAGTGKVQVYEDCICILPPNIGARRLPFAFINSMNRKLFDMTLTLITGETCTLYKMGFDTDNFERQAAAHISALREKSLASAMVMDPSLSIASASKAIQMMPEGMAAAFDDLVSILPSYAAAVRKKLNQRVTRTLPVLQEICDRTLLSVGMKTVPAKEPQESADGADSAEIANSADSAADMPADAGTAGTAGTAGLETGSGAEATDSILWVIAPGKNHCVAAVELSLPQDAAAATYLYRTGGQFSHFLQNFNRAFEAADFHREFIFLSDGDMQKDPYALYRMLIARTPALSILRKRFLGRVIHTAQESWKKKVLEYLSSEFAGKPVKPEETVRTAPGFCTSCSARLSPGTKFCRNCGAKI